MRGCSGGLWNTASTELESAAAAPLTWLALIYSKGQKGQAARASTARSAQGRGGSGGGVRECDREGGKIVENGPAENGGNTANTFIRRGTPAGGDMHEGNVDQGMVEWILEL